MRGLVMMAVAAMVAAPAVAAPTTLVWDQFVPPPSSIANYSYDSNDSYRCSGSGCNNSLVIDDFMLTGTTRLTSLRGITGNQFTDILPFVENWQVDVFSSPTAALGLGAGDVASMIVASGVSVTAVPTDFRVGSGVGDVVTVPIDITLAAGSYWLGLRPKVTVPFASFSVVNSATDPNRVGNFWAFGDGYQQFRPGGAYYQLSGQAVPEPASWAMLIAGFGLVGAAARRRRVLAA